MFHRAFKEWCFAMHELDVLQGKQWADCPSCFGSQHSCHVDGNAKLYRYKCVPRYLYCGLANILLDFFIRCEIGKPNVFICAIFKRSTVLTQRILYNKTSESVLMR